MGQLAKRMPVWSGAAISRGSAGARPTSSASLISRPSHFLFCFLQEMATPVSAGLCRAGLLLLFLAMLGLGLLGGCDRGAPQSPATAPAHRHPTVACVVPAATDIILNMGLANHLVGVSNYEPKTSELRDVPRVGDYHTVDWERLSVLRPDILVINRPQAQMPAAFRDRAAELGIRLVDIHIDRLEDIYIAIRKIGSEIDQRPKAQELEKRIRSQLDAVRQRVAGLPPVPTILVLDDQHTFVVGPRNYLDDLLVIAGGRNLAGEMSKDYPTIDTETLISLNPPAVVQLLPEAPPQVVEQARQRWEQLSMIQAVKDGRVIILTDWYLTLPSTHIGEVCQKLAEALHPSGR